MTLTLPASCQNWQCCSGTPLQRWRRSVWLQLPRARSGAHFEPASLDAGHRGRQLCLFRARLPCRMAKAIRESDRVSTGNCRYDGRAWQCRLNGNRLPVQMFRRQRNRSKEYVLVFVILHAFACAKMLVKSMCICASSCATAAIQLRGW